MSTKEQVMGPSITVFEYSIPIPDYYREDAFYKTFLFKEQQSKDSLIALCRKLIEWCHQETNGSEFDSESNFVINTLLAAKDWPVLGARMVQTNVFVAVPDLPSSQVNKINGQYPLSVRRVDVY